MPVPLASVSVAFIRASLPTSASTGHSNFARDNTEDSKDTEDHVSDVDSVSTDSSFDDHYSHYTPPASKQRKRELTVSLEVST